LIPESLQGHALLAPSVGCHAASLQTALIVSTVPVPERLWEFAPSAGLSPLSCGVAIVHPEWRRDLCLCVTPIDWKPGAGLSSVPVGLQSAGWLAGRPCATRCSRNRAQIGPAKVSQAVMSPLSKPRLNHFTRCAEVPWVKLSGTTS